MKYVSTFICIDLYMYKCIYTHTYTNNCKGDWFNRPIGGWYPAGRRAQLMVLGCILNRQCASDLFRTPPPQSLNHLKSTRSGSSVLPTTPLHPDIPANKGRHHSHAAVSNDVFYFRWSGFRFRKGRQAFGLLQL